MDRMAQRSASENKKTIFIIRHGETEFNRLGIVQGSGVDTDLNELGHLQAQQFYNAYQHENFDKIYVSSLKRTRQSVAGFLLQEIPYEVLPELNEISWGEFEGKKAQEDWKEDYLTMISEWAKGNLEYRVANGENPLELQERQRKALRYILSKNEEQKVLICMHGRALKSFLCLMLNKPLAMMEDFSHRNLGLYVLEYDGNVFSLIKQNCSNHLLVE